ncbi:MAG: outer rane receptor for ferrienterochelin and colicin, partial [Sediminibacterium sp.]|nr:outer rane receptor for ferrienterochelin and colicin [Sediminibacterium sp.]
ASGTNGGQAGIAPLSMEAIDQFQVVVSPYDASIGNFTGAGINAVTRSGSNRSQSAVYWTTGNAGLTGRTPDGLPEKAERPEGFAHNTAGFRTQGPIRKNILFYFLNMEWQRDVYPQPSSFDNYQGNTKDPAILQILANTLKGSYHYNAGSFLQAADKVNAQRFVARLDWNLPARQKLSISTRYTHAVRANATSSDAATLHFSNDGYLLNTATFSTSVELKTVLGKAAGNKLLMSYTQVRDDRQPLGRAFPKVRINDGEGALIFGTDNSSTTNLLIQNNWALLDKYTVTAGRHALGIGADLEYNKVFNDFIQNSFGNYTYSSLGDFLGGFRPSAYQLGFAVPQNNGNAIDAAARFGMLKISFFVNDAWRKERLSLSYGLRVDQYQLLSAPAADSFTNAVALPVFEKYYDLQGTRSGLHTRVLPSLSPRLGWAYRLPAMGVVLRGGLGVFSGRMPLAWPAGTYQNNGVYTAAFMAGPGTLNRIRFREDPYHQWTPAELGVPVNKEPLNLTAAKIRMPALWRSSLALDKHFTNGWTITLEAMYAKNLSEIAYTNINLLPPAAQVTGPDTRPVYSSRNNARIPINADSSNPYDYAILLHNNHQQKGSAYDFDGGITGRLFKWDFGVQYHYGHSVVLHDGTSSVNVSQWRFMESVKGRNELGPSVSDFSAGHKITALLSKYWQRKTTGTGLSLVYSGQSGSPVSYVYGAHSLTRDDGIFGHYDLVYIPSETEIATMQFLANEIDGVVYSPAEQQAALDRYIRQHPYLNSRRGQYAERNADRTPFVNIIDLKIKYEIRITGKKKTQLQLSLDIFNFANLLNRDWGRRYLQPNGNLALIDFAGYVSATDLTPLYRFTPPADWPLNPTLAPGYSARWNAQLGMRFTF